MSRRPFHCFANLSIGERIVCFVLILCVMQQQGSCSLPEISQQVILTDPLLPRPTSSCDL